MTRRSGLGTAALASLVLGLGCGSSDDPRPPDELELRAAAFGEWFEAHHVTPAGGTGYAHFAAPDRTEVVGYSASDSTIWTGTYLAAESFRYAVTGAEDAREHAIRTVRALDTHLRITGVPGFVARFAAPDVPPWNARYQGHRRYVPGTGPWEGWFWVDDTSRDQYTGWFFGLAIAHDLVDDEEARELIRAAVREVIDEIAADDYVILGQDGEPTGAGPEVIHVMRLCWHLIAAHVLDEPEYWARYEERWAADERWLELSSFSALNKYFEYYAFNLLHETYFNLLRLERDPDRRARYLQVLGKYCMWYNACMIMAVLAPGVLGPLG